MYIIGDYELNQLLLNLPLILFSYPTSAIFQFFVGELFHFPLFLKTFYIFYSILFSKVQF